MYVAVSAEAQQKVLFWSVLIITIIVSRTEINTAMSSLKHNFCGNYIFSRLRYIVEMAKLRAFVGNLCLFSFAACSLQKKDILHPHDVSTQNCVFFFHTGPADTPISLGIATSCISATQSNHKLLRILRTGNRIFELVCNHPSCHYDVCINTMTVNRTLRYLGRKQASIFWPLWIHFFYFFKPLGWDSSCITLAVWNISTISKNIWFLWLCQVCKLDGLVYSLEIFVSLQWLSKEHRELVYNWQSNLWWLSEENLTNRWCKNPFLELFRISQQKCFWQKAQYTNVLEVILNLTQYDLYIFCYNPIVCFSTQKVNWPVLLFIMEITVANQCIK